MARTGRDNYGLNFKRIPILPINIKVRALCQVKDLQEVKQGLNAQLYFSLGQFLLDHFFFR
jgi:hypothetical protein